ncbi:hypothetical protein [Gimesia aquarii]|uniref:hypothetical protein n=1 Tax=Gimesia aquarii TaxID=2527964 RepID=UPI0011A51596|nr:hypothetical protein [Gimesia aquarii]
MPTAALITFNQERCHQSAPPQMVLSDQKIRNGVTDKMGNMKRKGRVDRFIHELATPFALTNPH